MNTIGPPAGNGHLDTILVQAQGDTGDHTNRQSDMAESMRDSNDVEPKSPTGTAQKYDGEWKAL